MVCATLQHITLSSEALPDVIEVPPLIEHAVVGWLMLFRYPKGGVVPQGCGGIDVLLVVDESASPSLEVQDVQDGPPCARGPVVGL